jgi:hypothetical protein
VLLRWCACSSDQALAGRTARTHARGHVGVAARRAVRVHRALTVRIDGQHSSLQKLTPPRTRTVLPCYHAPPDDTASPPPHGHHAPLHQALCRMPARALRCCCPPSGTPARRRTSPAWCSGALVGSRCVVAETIVCRVVCRVCAVPRVVAETIVACARGAQRLLQSLHEAAPAGNGAAARAATGRVPCASWPLLTAAPACTHPPPHATPRPRTPPPTPHTHQV